MVNIHQGHLSENKLRHFQINGSVLLSIWEGLAEGEEEAEILWNIQEVSIRSKLGRRLIRCCRQTPRFSLESSCWNSCCPIREDARCSDRESGKKKKSMHALKCDGSQCRRFTEACIQEPKGHSHRARSHTTRATPPPPTVKTSQASSLYFNK